MVPGPGGNNYLFANVLVTALDPNGIDAHPTAGADELGHLVLFFRDVNVHHLVIDNLGGVGIDQAAGSIGESEAIDEFFAN